MKKQELIKKAYGQSWLLCQPFTDDNGWCVVFKDGDSNFKGIAGNQTHFNEEEIEGGQLMHSVHGKGISFRPKSLHGIEHNNGWTKIESENDLPTEYGFYLFVIKESGKKENNEWRGLFKNQILEHYSHWRPIIETPNPLY